MGSPEQRECASQVELRRACAELESSLDAGEASDAESVFAAHPALGNDSDAALEVIFTEFVARERLGQRPATSDYYARFPQWRDELQQLFEIHRAAGGDSAAGASGATRLDGRRERPGMVDECDIARRLGNYEMIGEIGRGGMGVVYKARQVGLNRLVALKMILAGDDAGPYERARFHREAESAARLHHPNIVQIHEVGEHGGRPFLSLEFVDGGTLEDALVGAPWPSAQSARLIETLARAMHHAHQQGVVHRDLKPANILMQSVTTEITGQEVPGERSQANPSSFSSSAETPHHPAVHRIPKITDFGLARQLSGGEGSTQGQAGPTQSGAIVGTPAYMAPEQTLGDGRVVGPAADIYALGAILYELLTGRPPFLGLSVLDTLEQVRHRDPLSPSRLLPGLARDLETICLKCLHKEPGHRYETAAALADDLGRFQRGEPIHARPTPAWEKAWKWAKRRPAIVLLLAALGVTAAAGGTGVAMSWRQTVAALDREREQKNELEKALAAKVVSLAEREWMANDVEAARRHLDECPPAYRGTEWRYLNRVCNGCLCVCPSIGLPADVRSIVWSPDGRSLASTYTLGTFTVWDPNTGIPRFTVKGPSLHQIYQLTINSDGLLVSVSWGGTTIKRVYEIKTLDVQTGREVSSQAVSSPVNGANATLCANGRRIALTLPGQLLLLDIPGQPVPSSLTVDPKELLMPPTLSADGRYFAWWFKRQEVRVWDSVAGQLTAPPIPTAVGQILTFSPDGGRIAAAGYRRETSSGDVMVHDVRTGKKIAALRSYNGNTVGCVAFSPDGRRLATSGMGHCVVVWDLESGRELLTFRGHRDQVLSLAFSPDGDRLASGSRDGTVRIWDVRPFEPAAD